MRRGELAPKLWANFGRSQAPPDRNRPSRSQQQAKVCQHRPVLAQLAKAKVCQPVVLAEADKIRHVKHRSSAEQTNKRRQAEQADKARSKRTKRKATHCVTVDFVAPTFYRPPRTARGSRRNSRRYLESEIDGCVKPAAERPRQRAERMASGLTRARIAPTTSQGSATCRASVKSMYAQ